MAFGEFQPGTGGRTSIDILDQIERFQNSPVRWSSVTPDQGVEKLLDDLEEAFYYSMQPWHEYRTVPDVSALSDFYCWHEYMFPPDIFDEARRRFCELNSTSRFSVESAPVLYDLERVHSTNKKITIRHAVSLAAMVCIHHALLNLDSIERWLIEDTLPFRADKSFSWFVENDAEQLDQILSFVYEKPEDRTPFQQRINDAKKSLNQANLWLSHLATLDLTKRKADLDRRFEKSEKSKKAKSIAKKPRKVQTKKLTPELVAERWNIRQTETKWELFIADLATEFGVSERTVSRRYTAAKDNNLVS